MSNVLDLEKGIECIQVIVDNSKCGICDNTEGSRARYSCGHVACDKCVATSTTCLLCLTPPDGAQLTWERDNPLSIRASNARNLFSTFQETFKVDVSKRRRISDQLKLEKQVFPQCVQAPSKYYNKRKSSIAINKENHYFTFFPGEQISPVKKVKMENSLNYVQQWLNNNDLKSSPKTARIPFSDLNTNHRIPRRADKILQKVKETETAKISKRKLTLSTSKTSKKQLLQEQFKKPVESKNKGTYRRNNKHSATDSDVNQLKADKGKHELGSVIDDQLIVIDLSQNETVDKDKLAWLAVLEANEKDPYISSLNPSQCEKTDQIEFDKVDQPEHIYKVPFYKKSYLIEKCSLCKDSMKGKHETKDQPEDISVVIDSKHFTTSIKVSTVKNIQSLSKHSVHVQTDINMSTKQQETLNSQDLFTADVGSKENELNINENIPKQITIADSDSDDAANQSSTIEVIAEVHRSSDQLNSILTQMNQADIQGRSKRKGRGHTPNSSDSSDKENFDPNKPKRKKPDKKEVKKRKIYDNFELNPMICLNN